MTITTTAPRIYVACLASYNNGVLHGAWIDLDGKDADDLGEDVAAMLRTSPYPNVMVETEDAMVPSAEEWAIHDHEGFGRMVGEYTSLEDVAAIAEALGAGHGLGLRYLIESNGYAIAEALAKCEDVSWSDETPDEYAASYMADTGALENVPEQLLPYFDFAAFARDMLLGGDICEFDDADEGRVVITNASEF